MTKIERVVATTLDCVDGECTVIVRMKDHPHEDTYSTVVEHVPLYQLLNLTGRHYATPEGGYTE